jgi:hypothetical protein
MSDEKNTLPKPPHIDQNEGLESSAGQAPTTDYQKQILAEYGISNLSEIDSIQLSILIIAKSKSQMEPAGLFLSRRGWPTVVTSSMSEAINTMVSRKPKFVLISANHPNPKIAKLPGVLGQAFNTRSIGFAEKGDGISQGLLNSMRTTLKFFGQLSGPSIHRQIKKVILDEVESAKDRSDDSRANESNGGQDQIRVMGEAGGGNDTFIQSGGQSKTVGPGLLKGGAPSDVASLLKMFGENSSDEAENGDPDHRSGDSTESLVYQESGRGGARSKTITAQSGTARASNLSPEGERGKFSGTEETTVSKQTNSNQDFDRALDQDSAAKKGSGEDHPINPSGQDIPTGSQASSASVGSFLAATSGSSKSPNSSPHGDVQDSKIPLASTSSPTSSSSAQADVHTKKEHKPSDAREGLHETGANDLKSQESLGLAKAIKNSLEEVCRESNSQTNYLVKVENLGVIPYVSANKKGFVAVTWAEPMLEKNQAFLEAFKYSLMNFLAQEGVEASLNHEFLMAMPSIDFTNWARKTGNILVVKEHEGVEVGVSFFDGIPDSSAKPPIENQMIKIDLLKILPETPVRFKAYLKMELNNKYIVYLAAGRKISETQKKRLRENSVKFLHIRDEDFENFRKYQNEVEISKLLKAFTTDLTKKKSV